MIPLTNLTPIQIPILQYHYALQLNIVTIRKHLCKMVKPEINKKERTLKHFNKLLQYRNIIYVITCKIIIVGNIGLLRN